MTSSNGNIFRVTCPLWGKSTGGLPSQRPLTRSFDVFFDLRMNKQLSKKWRRRWFETPVRSLWRHWNAIWFADCYLQNSLPRDINDDKTLLFMIMAWCRQAPTHYLSQCWPTCITPYGVTGPHWLNGTINRTGRIIQFCRFNPRWKHG